MHDRMTVETALGLARAGTPTAQIASALGVPVRTVHDWVWGRLPRSVTAADTPCGVDHDPRRLTELYVYLLGLYLGDGCISRHPRDVHRLRIILDQRYPGIVRSALDAVTHVSGKGAAIARPDHCVEVYSYWKHWPCLFPQAGAGPKHRRPIVLVDWQQDLVDRLPEPLLRGLIHSDGCRAINTGRGGWSHPRYSFSNRSADIHAIFREACDRLGVHFTVARPYTTYVSRKADVARLDAFVGPKR